jgi:hypothetical protein
MALSRVNRHAETSGNAFGTGTFTTTSFTPANNTLLVCRISAHSQANDAFVGSDLTISGGGLTWTSRVVSTTDPGWAYGDRVWSAPVTTGASMTIAADAGAFAIENYRVEVYEYSGHDSVSPIGTSAVGSDADGDGAGNITLGASPASTSEVLAFANAARGGGAGGTIDVGAGWTEIYDTSRADWWDFQAQSRTSSTSTSVDWADLAVGAGAPLGATLIALEIKQAAAPTIDTQPQSISVPEGETAQFTVSATSSGGALTYQWQVDTGGGFANVTLGSGATTATYTTAATRNAEADTGYNYRCNVTDDNGTTATDGLAELTVIGTARLPWVRG